MIYNIFATSILEWLALHSGIKRKNTTVQLQMTLNHYINIVAMHESFSPEKVNNFE